jgi:hypothetical protein
MPTPSTPDPTEPAPEPDPQPAPETGRVADPEPTERAGQPPLDSTLSFVKTDDAEPEPRTVPETAAQTRFDPIQPYHPARPTEVVPLTERSVPVPPAEPVELVTLTKPHESAPSVEITGPDTPPEPAEPKVEPSGASIQQAEPPEPVITLERPVRMRTVVLGLVLLVIAGSVLVGELTDVTVDAGAILLALMIGGGVLLIIGALSPRRARHAP